VISSSHTEAVRLATQLRPVLLLVVVVVLVEVQCPQPTVSPTAVSRPAAPATVTLQTSPALQVHTVSAQFTVASACTVTCYRRCMSVLMILQSLHHDVAM